jgi:hypothetical protein
MASRPATGPGLSPRAPVKEHEGRNPERLWLAPLLLVGGVHRECTTESPHSSRSEHQLHGPPADPPRQGDGSRRIATPRHARHRGAECREGMMPFTNLCNCLVFMRTLRMPNPRATGLSPCRPPQPSCPSPPRSHAPAWTRPSTTTLVDRCRPSSPEQQHRMTSVLPAATLTTTIKATRAFESRPTSAFSTSASPMTEPQTPPVVPGFQPPKEPSSRTRTRSSTDASPPSDSRARGAFRRQVPFGHPTLSRETSLPGRHWYPDFAAGSPAFDMLSRAALPPARPANIPGYSPELSGHMPPVDFCN